MRKKNIVEINKDESKFSLFHHEVSIDFEMRTVNFDLLENNY
jgi:hypothetical protein